MRNIHTGRLTSHLKKAPADNYKTCPRPCGHRPVSSISRLPHDLPPGPCNAGTALHSPSRPPGPVAREAPHEHFFFISSCCVRSRERRIIASSRSCSVYARESDINPPGPTVPPRFSAQSESPNGALCTKQPKPRHTCSPSQQWDLSGWRVNNAASAGSQPQGTGCGSQALICLRIVPDKH